MNALRPLIISCLTLFTVLNSWAAQEGDSSPECTVRTFENDRVLNLSSYKGKVVYLDFWASWCSPCLTSFPLINELRNELHGRGFEVVAINLDEHIDDAVQFLEKQPVDFKIAFDPEGSCPSEYDIQAMPSSFLIDRDGVIRHVHQGFRREDITTIRDKVLSLLTKE